MAAVILSCGTASVPDVSTLPTSAVGVYDPNEFQSVAEMAAASDMVLVGSVDAVVTLSKSGGHQGIETVGLVLTGIDYLKGDLTEEIVVGWSAYFLDDKGTRVSAMSVYDMTVPGVGDQLVWFLEATDPDELGPDALGQPTHALISFDGALRLVDGRFAWDSSRPKRIGAELDGKPVGDLAVMIAG